MSSNSVVWVTGARGFIGRHLALELSRQNMTVFGIGNGEWSENEASIWGIEAWVDGEIAEATLDRLYEISGVPSVVYHMAGGSAVGPSFENPVRDFDRSSRSTICLLEWVRTHCVEARVVLSSSAAVYGDAHHSPISTTCEPRPYSPYGYHKRICELMCESYSRNYGISTAVVRLFSIYGKELRKQLLWDLCGRFSSEPNELELWGTGDEVRDWFHVSDAAKRLIEAAKLANVESLILNGGSGKGRTVRQVAEAVRDAWGSDAALVFNGKSRAGDPFYLVADIPASETLAITQSSVFENLIREYVEWFKMGMAER